MPTKLAMIRVLSDRSLSKQEMTTTARNKARKHKMGVDLRKLQRGLYDSEFQGAQAESVGSIVEDLGPPAFHFHHGNRQGEDIL